jgi:Family of unknown function (DUF5412)
MKLIIILASLILFCMVSCSEKASFKVLQKIQSPDKNFVATVFTIEGDATVPLNVHIFLGSEDESNFSSGGNIFRGIHSDKAMVSWVDNTRLNIVTDSDSTLLMNKIYGISIFLK